MHRLTDLINAGLVDGGHGRVRAHAAGIRASVTVEDPLVILGGREWQGRLPVADRQQRDLLAVEELLDDHPLSPEAPLHQQVVQRDARLALVGGDDHALARRQAVGLDHGRIARDRRHARVRIGHHGVGGRGDAGGAHHFLAEGLRALEPRGRRRRPEASDPVGPERVSHPGYQWRLGTDDHEIDIESPRERDYRLGVLRVERRIGDVDLTRDPGIARTAQDLGALRRARQRLDERVLAGAAPEDQNPGAQIAPMKSSIGIALSVS